MVKYFPLIDENGTTIGKATRSQCHNGSKLLHPVIHLHVFNSNGDLLLQKRSQNKDIQPGKWDASVGGHVDFGETIETALFREAKEELGIDDFIPEFICSYIFESDIEREMVNTYKTLYSGDFHFDPVEIEAIRFWTINEIKENINRGIFTPNFEKEFIEIINSILTV